MHCPTGLRGILHLLRTDEIRSWVVARGPTCLTLRLRHRSLRCLAVEAEARPQAPARVLDSKFRLSSLFDKYGHGT